MAYNWYKEIFTYNSWCKTEIPIPITLPFNKLFFTTKRELDRIKYIKPKYVNVEPIEFKLSEKTRKLICHYAEYTGLTESQVLEETLTNLLEDKDFIQHIKGLRNNVRIKRELGIFDE